MPLPSNKQIKKWIQQGIDLNLISRISSDNPNFRESDAWWKQGDGYFQCLHVPTDGSPESGLGNFHQEQLMLNEGVNTFMQVAHASNRDMSDRARDAISKMLASENRSSVNDADDRNKMSSLYQFRTTLENNVPSKEIFVRFYIANDSEEALRKQARELKQKLNNYHVRSNDGMQDIEYHAPFIPASRQTGLALGRKPQAVSVLDMGAGYPFNHTTLMDIRGSYLGDTRTGGAVNLNILQEDSIRGIPTMLIGGRKNAGKGKLVGKILDSLFAKGHRLFTIDLTGEYRDLTKTQGGRYINSFSGGHAADHINILEVMGTVLGNDGETDQVASFRNQRDKMKAIAQIIDPEMRSADLNNLSTALTEMYTELGLWFIDAEDKDSADLFITNVVQEDYPTLGHLVEKLDALYQEKDDEGSVIEAKSYRKLRNAFSSLLDNYRFLNEYSNFEDISEEGVVTFDLSNINDPILLNIQLYQILTLISSYAVANGKKNKHLVDNGVVLEKDQFRHTIIAIPGADKLFNFRNSKSLEFLSKIINSVATSYAAFIMEVSSLQNILLSSQNDSLNEYVLATRSIFAEFNYRVFSNLDDLTIPLLANALQGQLTESELSSLKTLQYGQFFLNIANVKNLSFSMSLSNQGDMSQFAMPYSEVDRYRNLS